MDGIEVMGLVAADGFFINGPRWVQSRVRWVSRYATGGTPSREKRQADGRNTLDESAVFEGKVSKYSLPGA